MPRDSLATLFPAESPEMPHMDWLDVDTYLASKLLDPDPILEAVLHTNQVAGLPAIDVSPLQGKFLGLLARISGATRILEIGTLGGYSTIWLARGLPANGRLISLEFDPHYAEVARNNIARAGFAERVVVLTGAALETLPQLQDQGIGPFDLIFIDADKASMPAYLEWSIKLARPGTVIVADNVVRDGEVTNPLTSDANVRGVRKFLDMVAADPRLSASALQTVGLKGWDGFALIVVDRAP